MPFYIIVPQTIEGICNVNIKRSVAFVLLGEKNLPISNSKKKTKVSLQQRFNEYHLYTAAEITH